MGLFDGLGSIGGNYAGPLMNYAQQGQSPAATTKLPNVMLPDPGVVSQPQPAAVPQSMPDVSQPQPVPSQPMQPMQPQSIGSQGGQFIPQQAPTDQLPGGSIGQPNTTFSAPTQGQMPLPDKRMTPMSIGQQFRGF